MKNGLIGTKYENKAVLQANPLIRASKNFDTIEGRLFYLAIMELNPRLKNSTVYDEDFKEIVIPTNVLMKVLGGAGPLYKRLVSIAKNLLRKTIEIEIELPDGEKSWQGMTIFSIMKFSTKEGGLHIKFNNDMKPFLLDFTQNPYTQISGQLIFSLRSSYGVRLMELLLQYKNFAPARKGNVITEEFTLPELRKYMEIPDGKYEAFKDFKKRCIDMPVAEINSVTDFHIVYDVIKAGTKATGICFNLELPTTNQELPTVSQLVEKAEKKNTAKIVETVTIAADECVNDDEVLITRLKAKKIYKSTSRNWLKQYGRDRLLWAEQYTDKMAKEGKVKSYGAYYRSIIESDIYDEIKAEEARIAEEQERKRQENQRIEEAVLAQTKKREEQEKKTAEVKFLSMGPDELKGEIDRFNAMLLDIARNNGNPEGRYAQYIIGEKKRYEERLREVLLQSVKEEYQAPVIEQDEEPLTLEFENAGHNKDFAEMLSMIVDKSKI